MPKGIPRQGHVAIAAPEGDERRPIIRAEAHMLQGQTESRPRLLHCPNDLTALAAAMMPVFHGISRAEGPFKQGRKTTGTLAIGDEHGGAGSAVCPEAVLFRFADARRGVGIEDSGNLNVVAVARATGLINVHPGRPRTAAEIETLVVRMAEKNRDWGYRRIEATED